MSPEKRNSGHGPKRHRKPPAARISPATGGPLRPIDDIVRDAATRAGFHLSRSATRSEVLELLAQLWPTYDPTRLARYGDDGDGGYLMPDDLTGIVGCISPGVADSVSFELHLADLGIESLMVDASIEQLPRTVPGAAFSRKFVGARTEGDLVTLTDLVATIPDGDLILQLDIEGDEYLALAATSSQVLERARIIVIELHHLYNLFEPVQSALMHDALRRVLSTHGVAHLHANNMDGFLRVGGVTIPRAMEVTFVRRDAMLSSGARVQLPHPLDHPCVPDRPDVVPAFPTP